MLKIIKAIIVTMIKFFIFSLVSVVFGKAANAEMGECAAGAAYLINKGLDKVRPKHPLEVTAEDLGNDEERIEAHMQKYGHDAYMYEHFKREEEKAANAARAPKAPKNQFQADLAAVGTAPFELPPQYEECSPDAQMDDEWEKPPAHVDTSDISPEQKEALMRLAEEKFAAQMAAKKAAVAVAI